MNEPIAKFEPLVKPSHLEGRQATTGVPTGCYQLTVGDLILWSEPWDKEKAEAWMPLIVEAVNEFVKKSLTL